MPAHADVAGDYVHLTFILVLVLIYFYVLGASKSSKLAGPVPIFSNCG